MKDESIQQLYQKRMTGGDAAGVPNALRTQSSKSECSETKHAEALARRKLALAFEASTVGHGRSRLDPEGICAETAGLVADGRVVWRHACVVLKLSSFCKLT